MAKPTSEKLYVNLSASQVRRRLKGHGLGVRKIESAGRNQAVVMHTATGQHFRDLKALLADVMPRASRQDLDTPIENLRNLGPASAAWLHEVDVHTRADLQRLGPVLTYRLVQQQRRGVSLNLLWALAGALSDRDWRQLSAQEKQRLRVAVQQD